MQQQLQGRQQGCPHTPHPLLAQRLPVHRGLVLVGSGALELPRVKESVADGAFEDQQPNMPVGRAGGASERGNVKIAGVSLREEQQGRDLFF